MLPAAPQLGESIPLRGGDASARLGNGPSGSGCHQPGVTDPGIAPAKRGTPTPRAALAAPRRIPLWPGTEAALPRGVAACGHPGRRRGGGARPTPLRPPPSDPGCCPPPRGPRGPVPPEPSRPFSAGHVAPLSPEGTRRRRPRGWGPSVPSPPRHGGGAARPAGAGGKGGLQPRRNGERSPPKPQIHPPTHGHACPPRAPPHSPRRRRRPGSAAHRPRGGAAGGDGGGRAWRRRVPPGTRPEVGGRGEGPTLPRERPWRVGTTAVPQPPWPPKASGVSPGEPPCTLALPPPPHPASASPPWSGKWAQWRGPSPARRRPELLSASPSHTAQPPGTAASQTAPAPSTYPPHSKEAGASQRGRAIVGWIRKHPGT